MEGGQGPQRGPIGGGMARSDGVTRWPGGEISQNRSISLGFRDIGHFVSWVEGKLG